MFFYFLFFSILLNDVLRLQLLNDVDWLLKKYSTGVVHSLFLFLCKMWCPRVVSVLLLSVVAQAIPNPTDCNWGPCAAIVTECALECACDWPACECCGACATCMSSLYTECCGCVWSECATKSLPGLVLNQTKPVELVLILNQTSCSVDCPNMSCSSSCADGQTCMCNCNIDGNCDCTACNIDGNQANQVIQVTTQVNQVIQVIQVTTQVNPLQGSCSAQCSNSDCSLTCPDGETCSCSCANECVCDGCVKLAGAGANYSATGRKVGAGASPFSTGSTAVVEKAPFTTCSAQCSNGQSCSKTCNTEGQTCSCSCDSDDCICFQCY